MSKKHQLYAFSRQIRQKKIEYKYAPMAQLDSASDSDSDGWRFESVWVHHSKCREASRHFSLAPQRILYLLLTRLAQSATIAITLALLATNRLGAPDVSNSCCLRTHREQSRCNTIQNAVRNHGIFHLHPNGFRMEFHLGLFLSF